MNDRFKFRVWDKKHNEYTPSNMISTLLYFGHRDEFHIEFECFSTFADDLIIEQYTGLKDNCGNLIYEGDIIGDGEDDYVIKWDSNRTMFVAEDIDTSYNIEDVLDPTICVIGNIHEQAEQKNVK